MNKAMVACRDLGKRVTTNNEILDILSGVTLEIKEGDRVAVVGASGAGKSTLLGLLAGLDVPTTGEVWLAGESLTHLDEDGRARVRARAVGFVFQTFNLLPGLTALENVMLPLELTGVAQPRRIAREMLARVELEGRLTHTPRQLSGGEQQRVAIARAFAPRPRVLFADEPTGNLDRATGARIMDILFEMNREYATTLVLVTHDENLAARCARRFVLEAGRLVTAVPPP